MRPLRNLFPKRKSEQKAEPQITSNTLDPSRKLNIPDVLNFSIWIEKKADEGEDSEPILLTNVENGFVSVFDGMGGAGSTKYTTKNDGVHTGAYFSARIVQKVVKEFFLENIEKIS